MTLLTGQTETMKHFLQPTARATGHSVIDMGFPSRLARPCILASVPHDTRASGLSTTLERRDGSTPPRGARALSTSPASAAQTRVRRRDALRFAPAPRETPAATSRDACARPTISTRRRREGRARLRVRRPERARRETYPPKSPPNRAGARPCPR